MFANSLESFRFLILLIVGLLAVRMLFLRSQNRVSVFIPVAAGLVLFAVWGERLDRDETPATIANESANGAADPETAELNPLSVEVAATPEEDESLRIEETKYGKMLILPLSVAALDEYLGTEGAAALDNISGVLPTDLRRAYALVPIAGTVGDALPGLKALGKAVTDLAHEARRSATSKAVEKPTWVVSPTDDQIVVTGFEAPGVAPEVVLKEQVTDVVLTAAREVLNKTCELPDSWSMRRDLRLSDNAVLQCVADSYQEMIEIPVGDDTELMQSTSALIEIPDSVRQQAVDRLQESVRHRRTWTVGAATISLGLAVMLAAGLVQLAGSPGRLNRLVGIPVLLLILLPSLTTSAVLVRTIARQDSAPLPGFLDLPAAVIDVDSNAEAEASPSARRSTDAAIVTASANDLAAK